MATIPVNFIVILSLLSIFLYLLGVHNFVTNVDQNSCEMTYMFEFPQYVEISLPPDVQRMYPRYALYGYSEGSATEALRRMHFTGIPVLFIPGNSGSHKQGRSLASVALRRALNSRSPYHFNFFLADFNEDLSGLYGGVLNGHTDFVRIAIAKILSLYRKEGSFTPDSVILIGHSAGGIVAKNVFTSSSFDHSLVKLVITLATPHVSPALHADLFLRETYSKISKVWIPRSPNVSHVTLVSIGGGNRDLVVRSDLTKDAAADINVLTTAVPGVWCSTDHLSITWCKQLILTIIRALFDSVDPKRKQITDNSEERLQIFRYHLIKRNAGKKFGPHPVRSSFERKVKWIENLQRQFSVIERKGLRNPQFIMLRLVDDRKHAVAVIEAINLNVKDWVFVCNADSIEADFRLCDDGINLSNLTEIMPTKTLRRKTVRIDMLDLKKKGFSHVLVRFPPLSSFMQVNIDVHNPVDRIITYTVPKISSMFEDVVIESSIENAVHYTILLSGFDQIWQAFELGLQALACKTSTSHSVVTFSVPWANDSQSFFLVEREKLSAALKLVTPRPLKFNETAYPILTFNLDPSCKYKITMAPDRISSAGQIGRYFSQLLPGFMTAVLLLTLRSQLHTFEEGNGVSLFHNGLAQSIRKFYLILQTTIIASKVFGLGLFQNIIPSPDPTILQEMGLYFFVLPIILFLIASGLIYVAGAVVYGAVVMSGQAANKLAFRFLARTVTGATSISEWVFSALHQLPFIATALFVSISWSTTGGLGMALTASFYFLTLCKLYDDYIEEIFLMCMKIIPKVVKKVTSGKPAAVAVEPEASGSKPLEESEEKNDAAAPESTSSEKVEEVSEEVKQSLVPADQVEKTEKQLKEKEKKNDVSTLQQIHFQVTVCLLYIIAAITGVPSVLAWSRGFYESTQLQPDPVWLPGIILPVTGCIFWHGGLPVLHRSHTKSWSSASNIFFFIMAACCIMFGSLSLYRLPYLITIALTYLAVHQTYARLFS